MRPSLLAALIVVFSLLLWRELLPYEGSSAMGAQLLLPRATAGPRALQLNLAGLNIPAPAAANMVPAAGLLELLQQDRFCEVAQLFKEEDYRTSFMQSLGLEYDSRYREFTYAWNPYFGDSRDQKFTSDIARFVQALRLAGLMENAPLLGEESLAEAWTLLTELHLEQPQNAAFLFFRLAVEDKLGMERAAQADTIHLLTRTTYFDSLYLDFYREILKRMRHNASKFLVGISFLATLPVPSYLEGLDLTRELDHTFPGMQRHLGELLTTPGLSTDLGQALGGYNLLEYSIGRSLALGAMLPSAAELEELLMKPEDHTLLEFDVSTCTREHQDRVYDYIKRLP